jgi:hypothetical protein
VQREVEQVWEIPGIARHDLGIDQSRRLRDRTIEEALIVGQIEARDVRQPVLRLRDRMVEERRPDADHPDAVRVMDASVGDRDGGRQGVRVGRGRNGLLHVAERREGREPCRPTRSWCAGGIGLSAQDGLDVAGRPRRPAVRWEPCAEAVEQEPVIHAVHAWSGPLHDGSGDGRRRSGHGITVSGDLGRRG